MRKNKLALIVSSILVATAVAITVMIWNLYVWVPI